jgi:hypothetical protein
VEPHRAGKRPDRSAPGGPPDVSAVPPRERPSLPQDSQGTDVSRQPAWPDRLIGEIASRQLALVTRLQLLELGVRPGTIDDSLRRGRLRFRHRGVYALAHLALPPHAADLAAVLAVGEGAYLSHYSAAALWRMAPERRGAVQVTLVGRDAGRRRPGIEVHQTAAMDRRDVTIHRGIPVTRPARVLLDIAPDLSDRQLERMFDRVSRSDGSAVTRWRPSPRATPGGREPPGWRRSPPPRAASPR